MRRVTLAAAALVCVVGCRPNQDSSSPPITNAFALGALISDPARCTFYFADGDTGRLVALADRTGDATFDIKVGNGIGGLALDPCADVVYASVPAQGRIDVFDCNTFVLQKSLQVGSAPRALAPSAGGRLLVVRGTELVELDPASLTMTKIASPVAADAFLVTDRNLQHGYLAETVQGEAVVRRIDLANIGAPPVVTVTGTMVGKTVGIAVDFFDARIYVATDTAPGICVLDAATLAPLATIDLGAGLAAISISTTGERLFYADSTAMVQSIVLDQFQPGPTTLTSSPMSERGVTISTTNRALAVHGTDGTVRIEPIWPFEIEAPALLHRGQTATLKLHGVPFTNWFLFTSAEPAYTYLDPPLDPEMRLLELSLTTGFGLIAQGQLDANGDDAITDTVPTDFATTSDALFQAALIDPSVKPSVQLSNAMVIRFVAGECP